MACPLKFCILCVHLPNKFIRLNCLAHFLMLLNFWQILLGQSIVRNFISLIQHVTIQQPLVGYFLVYASTTNSTLKQLQIMVIKDYQ